MNQDIFSLDLYGFSKKRNDIMMARRMIK
jgi:hypothetical protein